jgi:DNA-binding beta-propeller fold protein YncE
MASPHHLPHERPPENPTPPDHRRIAATKGRQLDGRTDRAGEEESEVKTPTRDEAARPTSSILAAVALALIAGTFALPPSARAEHGALAQASSNDGCISEDGSGPCTDGDLLNGAFSVAVSGDGKNAYVALIDGRALGVFARDAKTGALAQLPSPQGCIGDGHAGLCTEGRGLVAPVSVALSPDGKNVYVASFQPDPVPVSALAVLKRDAKTGALTQLPGADGCISTDLPGCTPAIALGGSSSVAVSKNGASVYVASQSGAVAVFARNHQTGALTQLAEPNGCVSQGGSGGHCIDGHALDGAQGVAVSADGANVYVASERSQAVAIFRRNKTTGAIQHIPDVAGCFSEGGSNGDCWDGVGLGGPTALAVSGSGREVYVVSPSTDEVAILGRDPKTGMLFQLPDPQGCISQSGSGGRCTTGQALHQPFSVAVSPDDRNVYVTARVDDAVAAFAQNLRTGVLTQLPSPDGCIGEQGTGGLCTTGRALGDPRSVTVSKDGKHVYVAAQQSKAVAVLKRQK